MVRVEGAREDIYPVVEAVGMWESRRDFQREWEGWKAGFMAFHAFPSLSFPWPAFRTAGSDDPSCGSETKLFHIELSDLQVPKEDFVEALPHHFESELLESKY